MALSSCECCLHVTENAGGRIHLIIDVSPYHKVTQHPRHAPDVVGMRMSRNDDLDRVCDGLICSHVVHELCAGVCVPGIQFTSIDQELMRAFGASNEHGITLADID